MKRSSSQPMTNKRIHSQLYGSWGRYNWQSSCVTSRGHLLSIPLLVSEFLHSRRCKVQWRINSLFKSLEGILLAYRVVTEFVAQCLYTGLLAVFISAVTSLVFLLQTYQIVFYIEIARRHDELGCNFLFARFKIQSGGSKKYWILSRDQVRSTGIPMSLRRGNSRDDAAEALLLIVWRLVGEHRRESQAGR